MDPINNETKQFDSKSESSFTEKVYFYLLNIDIYHLIC